MPVCVCVCMWGGCGCRCGHVFLLRISMHKSIECLSTIYCKAILWCTCTIVWVCLVRVLQIHYDEFIPMFESQYPDFPWESVEVGSPIYFLTAELEDKFGLRV
jgi:hypothetical protein